MKLGNEVSLRWKVLLLFRLGRAQLTIQRLCFGVRASRSLGHLEAI
jgi:hypothetical protein